MDVQFVAIYWQITHIGIVRVAGQLLFILAAIVESNCLVGIKRAVSVQSQAFLGVGLPRERETPESRRSTRREVQIIGPRLKKVAVGIVRHPNRITVERRSIIHNCALRGQIGAIMKMTRWHIPFVGVGDFASSKLIDVLLRIHLAVLCLSQTVAISYRLSAVFCSRYLNQN